MRHPPHSPSPSRGEGNLRGSSYAAELILGNAKRETIQRARRLRTEMTDAEVCLWNRLRRMQIEGYRFRRQLHIGPYIVDFVCLKAGLVIEVDGGQHAEAIEQDNRRRIWLESQGFRVMRFWNTDVLQQTEGVLESMRTVLLGAART